MPDSSQTSASAARHERVRRQHQRELAQDYVEAIFSLSKDSGSVRVMDLQSVLGVSHVTVIRALGRLEEQGFVYRPKRGQIELTQTGRTMAEKSYARHQLVEAFLVKMGVPESVAAADAEGIEHHLGAETLEAMQRFLSEGA